MHYKETHPFYSSLRGYGYNCNRNLFALKVRVCKGEGIILAGEDTKGKRERIPIFLSIAYTQTTVRLYANGRVTILKSKRFHIQCPT